MQRTSHKPPRLPLVFQAYQPPLYFVTFCTMNREPWLADSALHNGFVGYAEAGKAHGVGVGHYVLMPDHVHCFVRITGSQSLGIWIKGLKRAMSKAFCSSRCLSGTDSLWQPGFFDHLIRHNESYAEKWLYVRDNPVRKGLVSQWEDWPYRGEIVTIGGV